MTTQKMTYNFSADKNRWLIETREISFEEVIAELDEGRLLDLVEHPNKAKYPNQKMYIVSVRGYTYLVPFVVESKDSIFLKTVIPNREANKKYQHLIRGGNKDEH